MENADCNLLSADIETYSIKKKFSREADLLFLWGGINILLGLTGRAAINSLLLVFGFLLIVIGAFIRDKVNHRWIIIKSILFFALAITNILSLVIEGGSEILIVIMAFIIINQISLGFIQISRAKQIQKMDYKEPGPEVIKRIKEIQQKVKKISLKDPSVIIFSILTSMSYRAHKALLCDGYVITYSHPGTLAIVKKEDFNLIKKTKKILQSKYNLKVKIGDKEQKIVIKRKSLERLEKWLES